ncbi:MAG: type I glutamate--ammonia ligase [Deltaproteobacteria bacterium RIFCSPLOWO2_12_FULL_40_28]|nr:MAG: type I glutamate--ammonia ligase [Deltaproteobacteria bacterium RIFCSPHIGHO2_02_FULL_40_28]OGQ20718.1 MAG: type I glutamate--ammonia ligase [Deltaproteobacteria bacterium RIFCSPHIGHO2_12_FULL_40_32]OGQ38953.1 MAG: type I glutamate--ammonia ligase [Deltaproteobacteria bacterium RIFCSPLOWO2_02_FULL_40_36]OGQ55252.1 MAG: type I glutamate--ammonia ligase [Deltaproteobacteria bacterium RIFCSPLOWO2_12_FULL_40_28]
MKTGKDVIAYAKDKQCKVVDLKFVDLLGTWQHFTISMDLLDDDLFEEGNGFDGSSIRGWKAINESDMLILPDPSSARIDPFCAETTLSLVGNVIDPITRQPYNRDPRGIAGRSEQYLKSTGIGDTAYIGPEAEFFIFDNVQFDQKENQGYYLIDSDEAIWNSGSDEGPNLGHKPRFKGGYFPCAPVDSQQDIRTEMILEMEKIGIAVEKQHHEVATAGQAEIDVKFDSLLKMADTMMWYKYIVKNVAKRHNKTVTFMPKPMFNDNGSGMHTHQSIWKAGKPLFAGDKYAGMSQEAMWYIGGILKHAPALVAITNPTLNSYKRLVPGFEAPVKLAYSSRNRSAAVRIPMYSPSPKAKRLEFRTPDPSCNPYLAFAAMLMAGLDGIENRIDPGQPLDKNIYGLSPEEAKAIPAIPHNLVKALSALDKDRAFLLKGDVFTNDVIDTWIEYKLENEVAPSRLRPTPYEFHLYYDC